MEAEKHVKRTMSPEHKAKMQAGRAAKKANETKPAERSPLNHAVDGEVVIDGMTFRKPRGALDYADKRTLDISEKYLNTGLNYRWVNDHNGLVESRRDLGYEVVPSLTGTRGEQIATRRRVGTNKDGSPLFAQLMATPKEFKAERDAAKSADRKAQNKAILEGATDGKESLSKDFYVKENHNKIET